MDLCYFILDSDQQLVMAKPDVIESLWKGEVHSDALACPIGEELRLITVLRDRELMPLVCYFAILDLKDGAITSESKIDAYEAMTSRHRRRYDHPASKRQLAGWPSDWQLQLAVALDVVPDRLRRIGVGGPLLMSDLWGIPLDQVMEYFEQADTDRDAPGDE